MHETMEVFGTIAAATSGGQLAIAVLLFWRVYRLEKKFDNGINKKIDELTKEIISVELNCAKQHGRHDT